MTTKYEFVTGEEVYVEVYGRFERIMARLDYEFKRKGNRLTKNDCVSFESLSKDFVDNNTNFEVKY